MREVPLGHHSKTRPGTQDVYSIITRMNASLQQEEDSRRIKETKTKQNV